MVLLLCVPPSSSFPSQLNWRKQKLTEEELEKKISDLSEEQLLAAGK